jgi:hypothetical protein
MTPTCVTSPLAGRSRPDCCAATDWTGWGLSHTSTQFATPSAKSCDKYRSLWRHRRFPCRVFRQLIVVSSTTGTKSTKQRIRPPLGLATFVAMRPQQNAACGSRSATCATMASISGGNTQSANTSSTLLASARSSSSNSMARNTMILLPKPTMPGERPIWSPAATLCCASRTAPSCQIAVASSLQSWRRWTLTPYSTAVTTTKRSPPHGGGRFKLLRSNRLDRVGSIARSQSLARERAPGPTRSSQMLRIRLDTTSPQAGR